jgi:formate/nitrite transporter
MKGGDMTTGFMTPKEVAESVVKISNVKSKIPILPMLILGMMAGVYIGFGAQLCTLVTHDLSQYVGVGFAKFIGGSVFTVGLMLVVIAGAELFTGNCLMLIGPLTRNITIKGMLRNWFFVYLANFVGSLLLVIIMYFSGLWKLGNLGVGSAALKIAVGKTSLPFVEAFFRGVGCNWLVCLAVWLAIAGKDSISKIFGIFFPIMAFVASGFEHSIANMYFIPIGLFLKGNANLVSAAGLAETINNLTWSNFIVKNLIPVTLGNIIGGAFFVAGAYYLVYLREKS